MEKRDKASISERRTSEEDMSVYRAAAKLQQEQEAKLLLCRKEKAWEIARQAAALLKTNFGAERVAVFGSLLRPDCFTRWSDVDIAAWGLALGDTFRAIGAVMDLGEDIEVNLVDMNTCRDALRLIIEQEGQEL
ncbi:MAG: nucleotidyltransferase domain-containing protein [Firmicutes bacterium]|nr:nucleotidyltransferase domain-containing protein [Bacillota bacterium]